MRTRRQRAGFTLAELMVSVLITVIVVTASVAGYLYVWQGERLNSTQAQLDVAVRMAVNALNHDLRLSAMDKVLFYPAGPGPYSAISFPMTTPNPAGLINYGTNGLIVWDKTVIYHVWSGAPSQLRVTTFRPRNNNLTDAQRQAQLNSVVTTGNGSSTHDSGTATTRVLFNNLVQWNIDPQRAVFDGYSSNIQRAVNYELGSVALSPGSHQFKFTAIGKNAASSSYYIGLDTLVMSPCGVEREAEAQSVVAGSASADYMAAGGWGGNYRLLSSCTASGQYFTVSMENDRWEETNFRETGAATDNTTVTFDTSLSPKDFVVQLEGPGYTWLATDQTGATTTGGTSGDALRGSAVRVLLRGSEMNNGNILKLNGSMSYVCFMASTGGPLRISNAYIGEAADSQNFTANSLSNGVPLLFNGSSTSYTIPAGSTVWAWCSGSPFQIDKDKSYLVSFLVTSSAGNCDAAYWIESMTNTPGSYLLPASLTPDDTMTRAANWSALGAVQTNLLYGVYGMYTTCPTNGTYTSPIVDTHQTAPVYSDINWNATLPSGSYLGLRVRSGNQTDLSDAPAWTNITVLTSPSAISPGSGRYIQFQAQLRPDSSTWNSPLLKNATIRWGGVQRIVDIGGTFSKGPNHGIWELTVDGNPLVKGVNMDMTIYKDLPVFGGSTRRMTSTVSMEIYPRNTGK